jgi:hypothetical protein
VIRWLKARWEIRRLRRLYIKAAREHLCKLGFQMEQSSDRIVLVAALGLAVHWLPVVVAATQAGEKLMVSPVFPVNSEAKAPRTVVLH